MNRKYAILSVIFAFSSIILFAQTKRSDNPALLYSTEKNVKVTIDSLNDLADTLCLHKSDKGIKLAQTALYLSKKTAYHIGIGDASHSLGLANFRRDNDSALYYFKQARNEYLQSYPGFEKFAFALNNISRTYDERLQYDSSMYYIKQALSFVQGSRENQAVKSKWLMYTYGAMANAFSGQNRNDSANLFYLKAINLAEQSKNNKMLAVYFKSLSGIQLQLGNYNKAAEYGRSAIEYIQDDDRALTISLANMGNIYSKLRDFENADLMADSSLMVGKRTNVTNSIGRNYVTLGNSRFQQKKYPEALKFFKTGLENAIYYKNSKSSISNLYIKIGNIYEVMDSLEKAKENYIKALQIGEGDNDLINNINLSLSKMFFKEGNYLSAYKYQRDYNLFKDSVFTNEKIRIITELNTRYDSEKKDQQLQILSKDRLLQEALLVKQLKQLEKDAAEKREQQLAIINFQLEDDKKDQLLRIKELDLENNRIKHNEQEMILSNTTSKLKLEEQEKLINLNTIRNQKSLFVIMFSVMIIIGIISFLLFNRYKLKKRLQVQSDLYQQRQQISRDLHDEIGATLSGIAMYSHLAKEQLKKSQTGSIENSLSIIQNNAGEMVNKLNDIVWLINPGHDSLQQLMQRLEDYAVQMAAVKNIRIKSNINGWKQESLLNAEIRRNIYLLFKEAINNAIKYSNATLLEFYANNENNKLEIILKDNGDGFEVDKVKRGNGLNSILQRGKDIGADVQLIASPGKGCMLIMIVPCL